MSRAMDPERADRARGTIEVPSSQTLSSSRRPTAASRTLAEQLQPIIDVHRALRNSVRGHVDVVQAQTRVSVGRSAFDAVALIRSAGALRDDFEQAARAFEYTGMASSTTIGAVRRLSANAEDHVLSWANSESEPRTAVLKLARSIAGLVGNAILAGAAADVMPDLALDAWRWPQCPCCGASPDLALSTGRTRTLVCWRCDTMWRTKRIGCLACNDNDPMTMSRVPSPYLGYELAICNVCGRYLKERRGSLTHDLLVERALTASLDEAAQLRGLRT